MSITRTNYPRFSRGYFDRSWSYPASCTATISKAEFDTHGLIRAQVNCAHRAETVFITPAHRDFDEAGCVYIYYVNDSDGDTILFNCDGNVEATVTPSTGHILRMDSRQWHCQTIPIRTDRRMAILNSSLLAIQIISHICALKSNS